MKDAKIPDHEKLPPDCIYYKHFLQVQMNEKLENAARVQLREDRELLHEIGEGLLPPKPLKEGELPMEPEDKKGNRLCKKRSSSSK